LLYTCHLKRILKIYMAFPKMTILYKSIKLEHNSAPCLNLGIEKSKKKLWAG